MKVSDVFKVPFIYAGTHFEDMDGNCLRLDDFDKTQVAVQAINSHDALVELNKELVKALKDVASSEHKVHMGGIDITLSQHTADRLVSVLNKAEETLKEQKQ